MKKENLIKFYQSYKFFIFPAAVALSSLFLIIFVIFPQTMKLIDNQKSANDLLSKSKFLETKVTALEGYDEQELSQKVELALTVLPADKDLANILTFLQALSNKSGFGIGSISFGGGGSSEGSNSLRVTMQIKGAKVLFQTFLDNLENSSRLLKVNTIDVSSGLNSQSVDGTITLEILYAPPPPDFGSSDAPLPEISEQDEQLLARLSKAVVSTAVAVEPAGPVATESAFITTTTTTTSQRGKANPFE